MLLPDVDDLSDLTQAIAGIDGAFDGVIEQLENTRRVFTTA